MSVVVDADFVSEFYECLPTFDAGAIWKLPSRVFLNFRVYTNLGKRFLVLL